MRHLQVSNKRKKALTLAGACLLVILITASAALPAAQAALAVTPTPTGTRTPSAPRPTPTRTLVTNPLKKQLVFGAETFDLRLFDGILPDCPVWEDLSDKVKQDPKLPYVHNAGRKGDQAQFCIYGLDASNGLSVELTRPDGSVNDIAQLRAEFQGSFSTLIQDQPYPDIVTGYSIPSDPAALSLNLWLPAGLPAGKWQIAAFDANGEEARGEFKLKTADPLAAMGINKPHVGAYSPNTSPFKLPQVDRDCHPYNRGQSVTLFMVNLRPETSYTLGVYRPNPEDEKKIDLKDKIPFKTNKKGNQSVDLPLKDNLDPGAYRILLPTNQGADKYWDAGPSVCLDVQ